MRDMLSKAPAKCLYGCSCPILSTEFVARQEWFTVNPELSPKFFPLAIPSLTIAYCQIVIPNWCPTIDREFLELCFVKRLWNVCDGQRRFRCSAFKSSSVVKVRRRLSPPFRTCVRRTSLSLNANQCKSMNTEKPSKPLYHKGFRAVWKLGFGDRALFSNFGHRANPYGIRLLGLFDRSQP